MADKLMYILNDYTQNYPFCTLQLVVEKFRHLTKINQPIKIQLKSQKLLGQGTRKRNYETLRTRVINSPVSFTPSLCVIP